MDTTAMALDRSIRPYTEWEAFTRDHYLLNSQYSFMQYLQSGSFGSVCMAHDTLTDTNVSIKAVDKLDAYNADLREHSTTEIAHREIKALSHLKSSDNKNICQMIDSFESSSHVFLVLEFCANGDLYDLIGERDLTMHEILRLSHQLGNAVLFSHSRGVFHRDIKPENIVIDSAGNFKLCDWGLASFSRQSQEFDVGTDRYMAPECFLRAPGGQNGHVVDEYDCKYADYWSVGITMLVAIFGRAPFRAPKREDPSSGIKDDTNFKNFVLYNDPLVLYDIYPCMNRNCFEIIMSLLRCGSKDDDAETFKLRLALRDLEGFMDKLDSRWVHKLLMDDDVDLEEESHYLHSKASVFDMDHDDLVAEKLELLNIDDEYDSAHTEPDMLLNKYFGTPVPISKSTELVQEGKPDGGDANDWLSMQLPSLIESSIGSSGSWCDWVDLDVMSLARNEMLGVPPELCGSTMPGAELLPAKPHSPAVIDIKVGNGLEGHGMATDWLDC